MNIARAADVAIVVVGNHPTCHAGWAKCPVPSDGKEAIDRAAFERYRKQYSPYGSVASLYLWEISHR